MSWSSDDAAFVAAVENTTLPAASFDHRGHVRLAWLYLCAEPFPQATTRMSQSIRRFATHAGAADKFHETVTVAWMHLVAAAIEASPAGTTFDALVTSHPVLIDAGALARHYSPARLQAPESKTSFVSPDLEPLPALN